MPCFQAEPLIISPAILSAGGWREQRLYARLRTGTARPLKKNLLTYWMLMPRMFFLSSTFESACIFFKILMRPDA
jgi:hypothetical protein